MKSKEQWEKALLSSGSAIEDAIKNNELAPASKLPPHLSLDMETLNQVHNRKGQLLELA